MVCFEKEGSWVRPSVWRWRCLQPSVLFIRRNKALSPASFQQIVLSFTHTYFYNSSLKSCLGHHTGWSYNVLLACATGTKKTCTKASHQDMKPGVAPVGTELWWASTSSRRSLQRSCFTLRSLCVGTELSGEPCEELMGGHAVLMSSLGLLSPRHGWQQQGKSPGPAAVGKQQKPHPKFPGSAGAEVWGLCAGVGTMFWNLWNGQTCPFFPLQKRHLSGGGKPTSGLSLLATGQHRQATSTMYQLSDRDILWSLHPSTGFPWSSISASHVSSCFSTMLGHRCTKSALKRQLVVEQLFQLQYNCFKTSK